MHNELINISPSAQGYSRFVVRGIVSVLLLLWVSLFVGGLIGYTGSGLVYTLFSLTFLAMLVSGFYRQVSYSYLFLVVFLWLGFWLKLTVHNILNYPYGEPVGYFVGSSATWDEVLWGAIAAGTGVIAGRVLYGRTGNKSTMLIREGELRVPAWYAAARKWLWPGFLMMAVCLGVANAIYGIQVDGLVPHTILPWPLNAIIALSISMGLAMGGVTLLGWDISLRKNISLPVYVMIVIAFISTVSLLSRAVYIFTMIPIMLALYGNRKSLVGYSRKNIIMIILVFVSLMAISLSTVSTLRNYYYSNVPLNFIGLDASTNSSTNAAAHAAKFMVDRWIGVEGMMAVASYPGKGEDLFVRALTERGEVGKVTMYQEVCQAHYRFMDMRKFQFASLPGSAAFFYYTGSLWMVGLGMLAFTLLVLFSEFAIFKLTENPIMSALLGAAAANFVAQFGVAPRQAGPYWLMIFCGVIAVWFLQSRLIYVGLNKLGFLRRAPV